MTDQWLQRWAEGRIGWHEADGNASLKKHWKLSGRRVLVPMCGKTVDMLWLAGQGNEVVGVELSSLAARAFFEENELAFSIVDGEMPVYVSEDDKIRIVCGDYFDFAGGPFDACYDRGALVALGPELRAAFAGHTRTLLAPEAAHLVITLEYDQSKADGPPFAVPAEELRSHWPGLARIDEYDDLENAPPKFRDAGLSEFREVVWRSAQ